MTNYLTEKYNVPAPRYTSYPTVPYWDNDIFTTTAWKNRVQWAFAECNDTDGVSLYIHLPFCEDLCTYCGCNTRITKNHGVEVPYIAALLKEWTMYCKIMEAKPVIREIHLGGGTPTFFSAKNLELLISGILEIAKVHPKAEFSFEGHPGNTTVDHLETLYKLGFRRISLGIQDFDPDVQLIINRKQSFEQVQNVTLEARRIGYNSVNYDLIYGLPLQTLDSLINTMNMVAGLKPDRIAFYSYAHVPWIKPGQRKFTELDLPKPELKTKLHQVGRNLLKGYGYQEIGMDNFALPGDTLLIALAKGKLHRNFMGYTNQNTQLLIGLGVSSISDACYAYAQNVKTVEEYLRLINEDKLPVVKGHVLTNEDLIIRKHILNIMCKGGTTWNHRTEPCPSIFDGIERLQPLVGDGLIELNSWGVEVTDPGKPFLRNICMALDERLWRDKPETQLFSMAV
ncbi:MAG: oxygen-independent coproporphyrinogen III oxidase [Mucilaginibacter sp.]|nr:oxygen-independent coproporphyrinogen III oxidase [Mucilaginibacter sp.]